ncbi:hypothetical protein [Ruminococcus sp. 5_1_39BFAA]|uniref:hypothetical protein n=1 Tax=Ruminococcus sp. 5_1_39BFAA TaxID=457412 RepID=UPI003568D30C
MEESKDVQIIRKAIEENKPEVIGDMFCYWVTKGEECSYNRVRYDYKHISDLIYRDNTNFRKEMLDLKSFLKIDDVPEDKLPDVLSEMSADALNRGEKEISRINRMFYLLGIEKAVKNIQERLKEYTKYAEAEHLKALNEVVEYQEKLGFISPREERNSMRLIGE